MKDIICQFRDNCGFGVIADINNQAKHETLLKAIRGLENLMHRGSVAADGLTGDGSGILVSIPKDFLKKEAKKLNLFLPDNFAVCSIFAKNEDCVSDIKNICDKFDLEVLFHRNVPINTDVLGNQAKSTLPAIIQLICSPKDILSNKEINPLIYMARKEIEKFFINDEDFYVSSFSTSSLSYKGLVVPTHLYNFFLDLHDDEFKITFALFHQRFSTNTLPKWKLAQPLRTLAHNGEINSISANRFFTSSILENIKSDVFSDDELKNIGHILEEDGSDTTSLDNYFEFLLANNVDFFKACSLVIPIPWENFPNISAKTRAYYNYMDIFTKPWDGPAAIAVTDGRYVACITDRNGLRPAKYIVTKDNLLIVSSEYGILDIEEKDISLRGKLKGGEIFAIDLKKNKIIDSEDIKDFITSRAPYQKWISKYTEHFNEYVEDLFATTDMYKITEVKEKKRLFNITEEIISNVIMPMATTGKEAIGSMGDDTPISAFSEHQRCFFDFFKQKFAQVTNPAIDPYRENIVMSLSTSFGDMGNVIKNDDINAHKLKTSSPILTFEKINLLRELGNPASENHKPYLKYQYFNTIFTKDLKTSLDNLIKDIIENIKKNNLKIIFLDDRLADIKHKVIPMIMVVGKLSIALKEKNLSSIVSIIPVSGEVYDAHGISALIAYGAKAVYPYMIFIIISQRSERLSKDEKKEYFISVQKALNNGIYKVMSKIGISTVSSYRHSSLFDVIGLSKQVVNDCFKYSNSLLHGFSYDDLENRLNRYHKNAYKISHKIFPLAVEGIYKYSLYGEYHDYSPDVIGGIQKSGLSGDKKEFDKLSNIINNRNKKMIRDFFDIKSDKNPINLEQVEKKEDILKRFCTAAMSLGAISPEAHEVLARAMNQIGAKSNSGEGGEDVNRAFDPKRTSKIKQVASGRFGVTPEYLVSAKEIQIKVAQGAKPGEGGQLPGHKVSPFIANLRYTTPGVTLISPPPHHDIYSIEDLAQLIFDLKQINPTAWVTVKLVSTIGVGTIAVGVAKTYADKIVISGGDGGTGAAPLTSIKYAGNPFELGLLEAHYALKLNGLREFVSIETDGGLKTALDVVKASVMGAEYFGFGTSALVLVGCKYLRVCHLNRCTVGVATQENSLRENFNGSVEKVVNYFTLLAEDIRIILAKLGYEKLDDLIGKTHLLKVIDDDFAKKFDFESLLLNIDGFDTNQRFNNKPFDDNKFEVDIVNELQDIIKSNDGEIVINRDINNTNRSFGARISGEIARTHRNNGFKANININLKGVAGQSFGAFILNNMNLYLDGYANDYVGKGMNGGKIIIKSQLQGSKYNVIGNTCLYGATGGKLFATGYAGERFAVRNSGAIGVIEKVGDHACEYMTGGTVVILGDTGVNFGAGMTGGVAFVYDKNKTFFDCINKDLVEDIRIDVDNKDVERYYLKKLIKNYYEETNSKKAKFIIDNFSDEVRYFWMIKPKNLKKAPLSSIEDGE
jgi:glutamate synthase (NADPH/NADH) large chain